MKYRCVNLSPAYANKYFYHYKFVGFIVFGSSWLVSFCLNMVYKFSLKEDKLILFFCRISESFQRHELKCFGNRLYSNGFRLKNKSTHYYR